MYIDFKCFTILCLLVLAEGKKTGNIGDNGDKGE